MSSRREMVSFLWGSPFRTEVEVRASDFTSVMAFRGFGEFALVTVMEAESFPSVRVYIAMV